jgi:hypothetical protein
MKDIYSSNQEGGQSIFNFKPQQLLQSPPGSSSIPIQVTQQKTAASIQVQPVQKIISTAPTQFVIRTQQPIGTAAVVQQKATPQSNKQQQFISLVVTPSGVKVQEDTPKLITSQVTIQNKLPDYQTVKSQAIPSIQMQTKKVVASASQVLLNPQQKTFQVLQHAPKPVVTAISQKPGQQAYKVYQKDARQIIQQPQQQIIIKSQPTNVVQPQSGWKTTKVITLQQGSSAVAAKPQILQQKIPSIATSTPILQQIPALAPIQRKITPIPTSPNVSAIEKSIEEQDDESEEGEESSQEEIIESSEEVKRIIEGDLNSYASNAANGSKPHEEEKSEQEEEEENMKDKCSEVITSQSEILNEQQAALSSDSLLCDEQISSISPDVSPNEKERDNESAVTPIQASSDINYKSMATDSVKKTLNLDLVPSGSNEKIQLRIEVEEEDDSVISDDTNMSMHKNITADNEDDSLHSKSELSLVGDKKTSKRSRKTKNPTVNTNLGLPYKPQNAGNRRKKTEKKMELELDFHDPLNKILWEDGIGGLNNCNKLFGFDEFGLVEVITKKDATAKMGHYESENYDSGNFKLKKILNPEDQFVCVVCSKMGTIRDFFSPECCSEACLAITKRKSYEYGAARDEHDSGQSSPTSEMKKVIYDGELISLQQLQTHLLQLKLPGHKRKQSGTKHVSTSSDDCFNWSSYLNAKSVPAPPEFFKNFREKQSNNPFKVGIKLEAIDPINQNLFCVCTVEERLGHRIKLHFDGYPLTYDFWVDVGSKNIFPIEFCRSTKRQLQIPLRWPNKNFDWSEYLDAQNSAGANRQMFPHLMKKEENCSAKIGMKLEVLKDDVWYAATIIDILGDRMLIKFDGIYEKYGYAWFEFNSPYIGPCDGHKTDEETTAFFNPLASADEFAWPEYLKSTKSEEVPESFFVLHEPLKNEFEPGMKLEVVDKINPQLIRPATVLSRRDYKIQVNFDGFDISYAYWLDYDSEEIYPINYCKQTGHPIEHPAGQSKTEDDVCATPGCRGIGNGIYTDRLFHERANECPYSSNNWKQFTERKIFNRLEHKITSAKR